MNQKTNLTAPDQNSDRLARTQSSANINASHHIIDELSDVDDEPTLAGVQLSLSGYLEAVKFAINDVFDHEVWIQAELRAVNSKGGHYYFELAEKDNDGNIIASTRATLWRYQASKVINKFTHKTGKPLLAGLAVLIKGLANFHPQYGFSINVSDIDPTYTLGALALAYNAMLKRLRDKGLTTLNKALPTPFDIRHVIVIAPERAAGLGDFRVEADRLAQTGACEFYYHHATFQGNHAPSQIRTTITHAIDEFYANHAHHADLLVIIRGGGAVGDLGYLNDEELATLVAKSPMPVWVGIGHERDKVLLDEVAHTCFDTPSKVILAIENHLIAMVALTKNAMATINDVSGTHIHHTKEQSHLAMKSIHHKASQTQKLAKKDSDFLLSSLSSHAKYRTHTLSSNISDLLSRQHKTAHKHIKHARQDAIHILSQHKTLLPHLSALRDEICHLQRMILVQHPAHTLTNGYALIHQNGGIISSSHAIKQGEIDIEFHDGRIKAVIK